MGEMPLPLSDELQANTEPKVVLTPHELLAAKFTRPHFITLFEVRDSTGFDSTRSADAIAISLYGSRGREINGFEIKVSRSDWLRELKAPEKAEEIGKFCDYFWLVTSTADVANLDEIPAPWGWMVARGSRLKVLKKAERLTPVPLDRPMLCSLLYATRKQALAEMEAVIEERAEKQAAVLFGEKKGEIENDARMMHHEAERVIAASAEFENASGLKIDKWDAGKIGGAVNRLLSNERAAADLKRQFEWMLRQASELADAARRHLAEMNAETDAGIRP
jgi:hypothetical protein